MEWEDLINIGIFYQNMTKMPEIWLFLDPRCVRYYKIALFGYGFELKVVPEYPKTQKTSGDLTNIDIFYQNMTKMAEIGLFWTLGIDVMFFQFFEISAPPPYFERAR